ncbi:MAG: hypothetical protein V1834_03370 [Candidatus Micrarchaeota archaeon]
MSFLLAVKPHLFCSIALFLAVGWMIVEPSRLMRGLAFVLAFSFFIGYTVFYGLEYDAFRKSFAKKGV